MKSRFSAAARHQFFLLIVCFFFSSGALFAQDIPDATDANEIDNDDYYEIDDDQDDTADIDTESTVDTLVDEGVLVFNGDFRPLLNYVDESSRVGTDFTDTAGLARWRFKGTSGVATGIQLGARLAGRCTTDDCSPEWVWDRATPAANGLRGGQFTFDELYVHLYRREKINFTLGRQQTRFVLRGGVFARSLDRNDSNNTNVTWTDGLHAMFGSRESWTTHFIIQRNSSEGTGSIRRGPLDFDDGSAKQTYFLGIENTSAFGAVTQRSLSVSFLPNSLLKDGTTSGPREDYWTIVGHLAARWPQVPEGPRLRAGVELGYAPERPDPAAVGLDTSVDGLAWNVAISFMDFKPAHSIGVNFGQTGAGWFLSPNFADNEQAFEIRYVWRPRNFPSVDARIRWREDIEQQTDAVRKRERLDAFLRLTWQFGQ
jgi:hypothetical protein